jgi:type VI secretion system secreted protein Hcp
VLIVPIVVIGLLFGWVMYSRGGSPSIPRVVGAAPAKLTAGDLLLAASRAKAGIEMQFDGVTGPPSANHTDHAPLTSFQWGVNRTLAAGQVTGRPTVSEIAVTRRSDKYSAPLLNKALTGGGDNAVIYFTHLAAKGQAVDYLEIDLEQVLISSYSMNSGGDVPSESMSLNFRKITIKYQLGGGNQVVTFDLNAPD